MAQQHHYLWHKSQRWNCQELLQPKHIVIGRTSLFYFISMPVFDMSDAQHLSVHASITKEWRSCFWSLQTSFFFLLIMLKFSPFKRTWKGHTHSCGILRFDFYLGFHWEHMMCSISKALSMRNCELAIGICSKRIPWHKRMLCIVVCSLLCFRFTVALQLVFRVLVLHSLLISAGNATVL